MALSCLVGRQTVACSIRIACRGSRKGAIVDHMRRPIAEILVMSVKSGSEAQHMQDEREMWQILRRKPGYVTHRTYEERTDASRRLAYSEWEGKKALDGARQHLN